MAARTRRLEKNTTELLCDLKKNASFDHFVKVNEASLRESSFVETFNQIYNAQGCSKAFIARAAGTSEAYLYQIFSGRRIPSRNRLLCICLAMHASVDDTQLLLRQCGYAPLYAREKRDAAILHGLLHQTELNVLEDMLFELGEETLLS